MRINGISVPEPYEQKANTHKGGHTLILGGGKCVWHDYLAAREIMPKSEIICVNDIGGQFKAEPINHIISLHKNILPALVTLRKEKSMLEHVFTHSHKDGMGVDFVWELENVGGTSGLFAVMVALLMGYAKIIVCGIPMDNSGHYFDPDDVQMNDTTTFDNSAELIPWTDLASRPEPKERVRAMSGRPSSIFGKPTQEWVQA